MASEIPKGLQTQQSHIHFESPYDCSFQKNCRFFFLGGGDGSSCRFRTRSHAAWLSSGFESSESRDTTVDRKDENQDGQQVNALWYSDGNVSTCVS